MRKLDEDTALAIIFANTKRKKRTENLLTIAETIEYLVDLYGSQKDVSEKVGLSNEMIREFRKILALPSEVQDMIRKRKIDRIDVAYRISMLNGPEKQIKAAKLISELPSDDVRDIKRLISIGGLSTEESKKKVLESKLKGFHVFFLDFDEYQYREILTHAKKEKQDPAEFIKRIIGDWLDKKSQERRG